jgi:hypothetical protein
MIEVSQALNEARLQGLVGFMAVGGKAALVQIYGGIRPVLGATPLGDLLVEIPLKTPVGTVAEGRLTLAPTDEVLITNTGQATWARVVNSQGVLAWDCDVSDLDGRGELRLASTTLYAGGFTRLVSGVLA